jgi:cell division protein ZapA
LAGYVDRKMRQIAAADARISANKAAVLAALNIANELFRLQKEYERLVGQNGDKEMHRPS